MKKTALTAIVVLSVLFFSGCAVLFDLSAQDYSKILLEEVGKLPEEDLEIVNQLNLFPPSYTKKQTLAITGDVLAIGGLICALIPDITNNPSLLVSGLSSLVALTGMSISASICFNANAYMSISMHTIRQIIEREKLIRTTGEWQELIRNNEIALGMPDWAVKMSWGEPSKINRTVTAGLVSEQWIYRSIYVYFENGVVTAWQN